MPIVPSRAERIRALVERLASDRPAERESAVAQLILQGPRVLKPLLGSLEGGSSGKRLAALEVLEHLEDPRALPALVGLASDASRAVALRAIEALGLRREPTAASTLGSLLQRATPQRRRAAARALAQLLGAGVDEALDPLVDTVVSEGTETGLRVLILEELMRLDPRLPRSTTRPLARRLATSRDPAVAATAARLDPRRDRACSAPTGVPDLIDRLVRGEVRGSEALAVARRLGTTREVPLESLHSALERAVAPHAVQALAIALGAVGSAASIPPLSRVLGRVARSTSPGEETASDLETRAALHSALAALDSAVALHDLRELIARHPPGVTPRLLEAAARVGNGSLVPALARAASEDAALLEPCGMAFVAIAVRERLRRSSAALRRVGPEHRPALEAFLAATRKGRR